MAISRAEKRDFGDGSNEKQLISSKRRCRDHSTVPFEYIRKGLRFTPSHITELQHLSLNHSMKTKKLTLVLDLDHTLMNSTFLSDLSPEERYLIEHISQRKGEGLLHRVQFENGVMLVKLRPFVRQLLREAHSMFDMYIYTMGTRPYATEIVKLLDPENKYFAYKVITRSDCTQKGRKALDLVLASKTSTVILDDTRSVWKEEDKENLIEMARYNFFASSFRGLRPVCKSLAERKKDEREDDGTLASILSVLKCAHKKFFNLDQENSRPEPDLRKILKEMRGDILGRCEYPFLGRIF